VSTSAVHALQGLLRLFCSEARRVLDHHLGRAQLVAHAGDELGVVLARQLVQAALVLDFAEQAPVLDREHRLGCERL
jgi:hypothetical protein